MATPKPYDSLQVGVQLRLAPFYLFFYLSVYLSAICLCRILLMICPWFP